MNLTPTSKRAGYLSSLGDKYSKKKEGDQWAKIIDLQKAEYEKTKLEKMQAEREAKKKYSSQLQFQIL